jgi:hypothetical protein
MKRRVSIELMMIGVVSLALSVLAQQDGRNTGAPAQERGRGAAAALAAVRPGLVFRETWKLPAHVGEFNDESRRVTQEAVTSPNLELKLYGAAANWMGVNEHEGRLDLWSGMVTSPVAVTLRDKTRYFDLTGLARLRWIVRTQALHTVFPVVKLANGMLLAGSRGVSTDSDFLESEVAFGGVMRWYKLDPVTVVPTVNVGNPSVVNPDLSRVDEIGWADLAPSGGHGGGWHNVSTIELYAKTAPR